MSIFSTIHKDEIFGFGNNQTVPAGTTRFLVPFQAGLLAAALGFVFSNQGTLRTASFRTSSNQPGTGSMVATLFNNGVATPIVITVPANGGATFFNDFTNAVPIAIGNYIWWQITNNASLASAQVASLNVNFEFQ